MGSKLTEALGLVDRVTVSGQDIAHWDRHAADWIAWARAPNHDSFWAYRDAFVAFLGSGAGDALDVGCGEGRVSREIKAAGYRVTVVDPVAALLAAAEQAGSADAYHIAAATDLPFGDARFDLVVAYNVLMDVDDMPAALHEIRRVLRPSGQLVFSIVHPFTDRGRFDDDNRFVLDELYLARTHYEGTEARDGLRMAFAGWAQPLDAYSRALEDAGLAITAMREPVPDPGAGRERLRRWTRVPLFLWVKARPLA